MLCRFMCKYNFCLWCVHGWMVCCLATTTYPTSTCYMCTPFDKTITHTHNFCLWCVHGWMVCCLATTTYPTSTCYMCTPFDKTITHTHTPCFLSEYTVNLTTATSCAPTLACRMFPADQRVHNPDTLLAWQRTLAVSYGAPRI